MSLSPNPFTAARCQPLPGRRAALALLLAAGLAGCNSPTEPAGTAVTLPAGVEARDSLKSSLNAPALDAISTTADSTAARSAVTPR